MGYGMNMRFLEIAITYVCNVSCNNCLALSPQAPTKRDQDVSVDDIVRFVDESAACAYPWEWIKFHGGEPTLHPQLLELAQVMVDYRRKHNPKVRLSIVSNDTNPERVAAVLALGFDPQVSPKVRNNTDKSGNKLLYVPVNVSPVDLGVSPTSGCFIPQECGIAMNNLGFWPCGPAAAAARVFGYEAPVTHVQDLTPERLMVLYKHCDHCGFAMKQDRIFEQRTSPTWATKLAAYHAS